MGEELTVETSWLKRSDQDSMWLAPVECRTKRVPNKSLSEKSVEASWLKLRHKLKVLHDEEVF